ncbi:MAG: hypothetical protein ABR570_12515 [Burkholderiales bacterium]
MLVAIARDNRERLAAVLEGWQVQFVASAEELDRALAKGAYDLVVVGAHFDESHAIDALKVAVRAQRAPVVCMCVGRFSSSLGGGTVQALSLATEALGAEYFLDLDAFGDDAAAHARVRSLLERLIPNSGSGP